MQVTRRDLIKAHAVTAAATAIGISVPGAQALAQSAGSGDDIRWDKGACRFCGTGCGVLIGVKDGRVVATQGDPDAPVNKGLNCIKGYFLSKIMYGKDRLTQPLLRMKDGKFDKNGEFAHISWDKAFDIMEEKCKAALKAGGPRNIGMFGSGQWTIWEGYAAAKLFKAGFRSNNIDPNARHCMASAVAGFMRTFGIDEPMGCYDDIEHADAFVLWGSNMAEMHPILWSRLTDRRLTAKNVKVHVLSTFTHRSCELADNKLPQVDLLDAVPAGYLVDAAWLVSQGIAYESFRDYVKRGWLDRITRGVFRRPLPSTAATPTSNSIDWKTCILSTQHIMGHDLHVGGTTALEIARSGADVKAIVGFHSGLATARPQDAKNIKGKVLVCIGADDPIIPPAQRAAFENEMMAAGIDWRLQLYGGAGHSFTNPAADSRGMKGFFFHEATDRRSWNAMIELFDETLK